MTKMVAMPIYVKNLKQSSFPEPKGLWPWNLVCSIGGSSNTKFIQNMTLGSPWPFYGKVKCGRLCFVWEKGKTMGTTYISETIVVYDVKVGKCS